MNLFDIAKKKKQVEELEEQTKADEFWTDMEKSAKVLQEIKALKDKIEGIEKTKSLIDDTNVLIELGNEANDESVIPEIKQNVKAISKKIDKMEIENLLSGKHDKDNAIITIHPGAGGTESQDWAEMLYRMYSMWCEKKRIQARRTRLS